MKEIMPGIIILTTEPLVNVIPPLDCSAEEKISAQHAHLNQFQSVDILTGLMCPELGGSPDLLDILGFNYYYNNQWIAGTGDFLKWANEDFDPRWKPFSQLLKEAYECYHKPVVLTETSHPGEDRPKWIDFIGKESQKAILDGLPFWGICIYPIIDRPDWDDPQYWHHSGLWDETFLISGERQRKLDLPYANALKLAQKMVPAELKTDYYPNHEI